jgi:hypothetical protein
LAREDQFDVVKELAVRCGYAPPFLRPWRRSVALDWGFPPAWLGVVRDLKDEGVETWWFHAAEAAARENYMRRGGRAPEAFEKQIASIYEAWSSISEVFEDRIITTISPAGRFTKAEKIFERMFRDIGHTSKTA